jgi:asparagine synthase (glutamine-hydrolysing)
MCGIVGVISTNIEEVSFSILKRMTDSISHRGPDGEGQWISQDRNVGFGHRRLSILDLSAAGKQPMHYGDGRYTITFISSIIYQQ